ncbi:hypothetical protein [Klebsiella pneumoniae]|uniref:hypothetical protein n=1 Tax=Klebsiella pneumoniae TaxID=573 RepID=UPI003A924824
MTITAAERALFPHTQLLLHRAVEAITLRLRQQDPHHLGVTPRELIDMFSAGSIAMCYDWGSGGLVVPDISDARTLNERHLDHLIPGEIPMLLAHEYGSTKAPTVMTIPHGSPYDPYDFDLEDFTWDKMVLPQAEVVKAYRLLTPQEESAITEASSPKSTHGNAERNALIRERILLAAGYVKFTYPDECKNKLGKESCAAWASALLDHWHLFGDDSDIPSIRVTEEIIRDIRKLPNMRRRAGRTAP